jgi:transcriptional regulator with XRE-family HTH domain
MNSGEKLRHLRTAQKLTQKELGKILGVSTRQIQNYEGNIQNPSKKITLKIMELFNVSADYLLIEENTSFSEEKADDNLREKKRMDDIIKATRAIFSSGELSQEEKDATFQVMQEIYWESKILLNKEYVRRII